jgi:hypothetical protein
VVELSRRSFLQIAAWLPTVLMGTAKAKTGREELVKAVEVVHTRVFAASQDGGNPCPVVPFADKLTDRQMQRLARKFGLDTAFILHPRMKAADIRLRYFVPDHEMGVSGHATIAAITIALLENRLKCGRIRVETMTGIFEVESIRSEDGTTVVTDVEVWQATGFRADPYPKPNRSLRVAPGAIGLLKPEISREQAQARLNAFASQLRAEYANDYPAGSDFSIEIVPLQESLVGNVRPMLLVLMGAVVLIILLASVNVANLLLARASGRQREMAVRLALGASRSRMIRQLLTESLILSLVSGIVGALTAMAALHFVQFLPARTPRLAEAQVDWTVLAFALVVSLLAGLGFGLVPALQSSKAEIAVAIRKGGRGSGTSGKTSRLRGVLIASESALAVVLMVGAGLLLRTFWGLLQENPGFNPSRIVAASLWLPVPNNPEMDRYAQPEILHTFVREAVRRVSAIPGVDLASITSDLPVTHLSARSRACSTLCSIMRAYFLKPCSLRAHQTFRARNGLEVSMPRPI